MVIIIINRMAKMTSKDYYRSTNKEVKGSCCWSYPVDMCESGASTNNPPIVPYQKVILAVLVMMMVMLILVTMMLVMMVMVMAMMVMVMEVEIIVLACQMAEGSVSARW